MTRQRNNGTDATLGECLRVALRHWEGRPGYATMKAGAGACVAFLGEDSREDDIGPRSAVQLLAHLRGAGKSPKTVAVYYGAFRRMLDLNGIASRDWPKAPTPPRKVREPMKADDQERLAQWFRAKGWPDTADLLVLMRGTGLRVSREGLDRSSLRLETGEEYDTLHVTGKGGNERLIPVVRADCRELLRSGYRLEAMRGTAYRTHMKRWNAGVAELGIKTRLATPHAVRHGYATETYAKLGGNLLALQELLGHTDPKTTSRYVSVDLSEKARALLAN